MAQAGAIAVMGAVRERKLPVKALIPGLHPVALVPGLGPDCYPILHQD